MTERDPASVTGNGQYEGEGETGFAATVKGAARQATRAAQGFTDYFRSRDVEAIRADIEQRVRQNPMASVAIGFGIGFLLAKLLRR